VPGKIALNWPLDLDHPSPEVSELTGSKWDRDGLLESKHGDSVECCLHDAYS
jgi:hypothetical protein